MEKKYSENFWDYAQRWRIMATQVRYKNRTMIGWCPRQQEVLPIWLKWVIWLTTRSRMAGSIPEKAAPCQKRAISQGRKKVKPKPYTSRISPINPKDTHHTKTTRTINRITQLRVIKHVRWFLIIHHPITKHKLPKHDYPSQTISQTLQGLITLQITNLIIPNLQDQQDLPWSQFRYHIPNCCPGSSKVS